MDKSKIIENSKIFQVNIYRIASKLVKTYNIKSVLDIGCGYPSKIQKFLVPLVSNITGVDLLDVIKLSQNLDFGEWIGCNIDEEELNLNKKFDLIISADNIEHLENPDRLLRAIKQHSHNNTIILISTPDGNTTLKQQNGQPANIQHKQEWNRDEFSKYLLNSGFNIINSNYYVESGGGYPYVCQYCICKISTINKKSILISIPNLHWIHKTVSYREYYLLADKRYRVEVITPSNKPYVNNLHHIVKDVLSNNFDYWLNIDADNPPTNNPLDLIELDKDIIGCPTPIWHFTGEKNKIGERPYYFNTYDYDSSVNAYREHQPQKGLQKVDAVGTGCILIARRVFENKFMQQGCFQRKWNKDGTMDKGNDISFCERARTQGFNIYAHYNYICDHFTELSLLEVIRAFYQMYQGGINNG